MQYTASLQNFPPCLATKTMLAVFALALTMAIPTASAQTYNVLYNFTGQSDGGNPQAGVTIDHAGNLYGTTFDGGSTNCTLLRYVGCGTVFKLSHRGSGWTLALLHMFIGSPDGANPSARVVFGPNGALFGTATEGGIGYGTVFQLQPPATFCPTPSCPWLETQLYSFESPYGAAYPGTGDLVFDPQGNAYGTAGGGGYLCDDGPCGTLYELSPVQGGWTANAWVFPGNGYGFGPAGGLVFDGASTFYGVTASYLFGGIYKFNDNEITEIYTLPEGSSASAGLILDSAGNLYGTTSDGGTNGGGTVFEYSIAGSSLTTLYSFTGSGDNYPGPTAPLLMDASGNLYGTTHLDGAYQQGSVFKLSQSNGVWTLTTLHDFTGGADGGQPFGQLIMDAGGNIYGTAQAGGNSVGNCYQSLGCGVVFEITP